MDARIEGVELRGDEAEVNSVELRDRRNSLRSWLVMKTCRPFRGEDFVKVTAKVTSSIGVLEMMRRGEEAEGGSEKLFTREGMKKEVGGVIIEP